MLIEGGCERPVERSSQQAELVVPRPEKELSPSLIDVFVERVPANLADFSYHAEPFGDEESARVASFLRSHRGHRVCSSLLPENDPGPGTL